MENFTLAPMDWDQTENPLSVFAIQACRRMRLEPRLMFLDITITQENTTTIIKQRDGA